MSDQPTPPGDPPEQPPPNLRIVKPKAKGKMSAEVYEMLAQVYLKGERSHAGLARAAGVARTTARRAIENGYPDKGWPALKERALLHDRAIRDEETKATAAHAKAALEGRVQARQERNGILRLGKAGYATLFKRWQEEAATVTYGKVKDGMVTIPVRQADGSVVKEERPATSGHLMALTGARLMQGFGLFARLEEQGLTDNLTSNEEGLGVEMPPGLKDLKPDDLDYIAKHGKLPSHITEEQVFGIRPGPSK